MNTSPFRASLALPFIVFGIIAGTGIASVEARTVQGLLFEDQSGNVCIGEPLVHLGMAGVDGPPRVNRLSPELAERLSPLVMKIDPADHRARPYWCHLPYPTDPSQPTILVTFLLESGHQVGGPTSETLVRAVETRGPMRLEPRVFELTSGRMLSVEVLSPDWRKAWDELDAVLEEAARAALEPPSEKKRKRLAEILERGSTALHTMIRLKGTAGMAEAVQGIDPEAQLVVRFQHQKIREWGKVLLKCVQRLGIDPETSLPDFPPECSTQKILAESESPTQALASLKTTCGEDFRELRLTYVPSLGRSFYGLDLEQMSEEEFEVLRTQAKKNWEYSESRNSGGEPEKPGCRLESEELGLVLSVATKEQMARNLILAGVVVEELLPDCKVSGLQKGDVILTCRSLYDLATSSVECEPRRSGDEEENPAWMLKNMAARMRRADGLDLDILRNGERIDAQVHRKPD